MPTYRDFLDYADGFYSTAKQQDTLGRKAASESYIITCILLSWIAIESFINDMLADFAALPPDMFSLPERALLTEQTLEFAAQGSELGTFIISDRPDYRPLEHKIMFLVAKFDTSTKLNKGEHLWQRFESMKEKRNQIAHPRRSKETSLTLEDAEEAIEVSKAIIQMVSDKVWKKLLDL